MKTLAIELLIFCLALTTGSARLFAQDGNKGTVNIEIDNNVDPDVIAKIRSKTESILKTKTAELRQKIDQYTAMHQRGEIGEAEMERRIEQEAERFEKEIEDEVANLEFVIERELSKNTGDIDIDVDDIEDLSNKTDFDIEIESDGNGDEAFEAEMESSTQDTTIGEDRSFKIKLPKTGRENATHTGIAIAFGWNGMVTDEPSNNAFYPEFKVGKSGYFEIGYALTTRLGGQGSKFYLNYGLVYNHLNFEMSGNSVLTYSADDQPVFAESTVAYKTTEFNVNYLTIPLTLRFGTKGYRGFGIEAGGYAGVRIGTNQLQTYESDINEEVEVRSRYSYGMNRLNAGLTAAIGWRWINVFAKYDMTPLFKENGIYDYQPFTAGIRFNLM